MNVGFSLSFDFDVAEPVGEYLHDVWIFCYEILRELRIDPFLFNELSNSSRSLLVVLCACFLNVVLVSSEFWLFLHHLLVVFPEITFVEFISKVSTFLIINTTTGFASVSSEPLFCGTFPRFQPCLSVWVWESSFRGGFQIGIMVKSYPIGLVLASIFAINST